MSLDGPTGEKFKPYDIWFDLFRPGVSQEAFEKFFEAVKTQNIIENNWLKKWEE